MNKKKAAACLVLSGIGWLTFASGIVWATSSPYENEFSILVDFAHFLQLAFIAAIIHVINVLLAIVFFVQKTGHKKFLLTGFLGSLAYIVFCIIPYLIIICTPFDTETTECPQDLRWQEYTKEHTPPDKEIQLNQNTVFMTFALSNDCQKALYASIMSDNEIEGIELSSGKQFVNLTGQYDGTHSLSFSPDGKRAVSGGSKGYVYYWDLQSGEMIDHKKAHNSYVRSIAYSPVGNLALSGEASGIFLWDLDAMQILKTFDHHTPGLGNKSLVWAADGKTFLSISNNITIRRWDIDTGNELSCIQTKDAMIVSIALSPNGKTALSSHRNGPEQPVIYWDLEAEKEINRFGVPGNPWHAGQSLYVESTAFSSDNKTALFGLVFGTVIWWDLEKWEPIAMNRLFSKELAYVFFSEHDKYCIAVGCDESSVKEMAKIRFWKLNPSIR